MTFLKRGGVALVLLLASCGGRIDPGSDASSDGSPPPSLDAQPPTWDGGPPIADGGPCNDLSLLGASVSLDQVASDPPPMPAGGVALGQGYYELTGFTLWVGASGTSSSLGQGQVTLLITSAKNGFDVQVLAVVSNQAPQHESGTLQITAPNQMTLTGYCGTSGVTPFDFYFDGTTLLLRTMQGNQAADERFALVTK